MNAGAWRPGELLLPLALLAPAWLAGGCSPGPAATEAQAQVAAEPEPAPASAEAPRVALPVVEAPPGPLRLRVTGDDFRWLLRYPGADGVLDSEDDLLVERHPHLPARREVLIELTSNDWIYTFYVPGLDLKETAVPEMPFQFELNPGGPGQYRLMGSQMCGYTHPELLGDVLVQSRSEFEAWSRRLAP